jgi:Transposase DNA-binding
MNTTTLLNPEHCAHQMFGQVQLQEMRRTRRAVQAACAMGREAWASPPKYQHTWKDMKALYRLLDEADVTSSRADAATQPADS